jgi:basic membrane protein A and related proteins
MKRASLAIGGALTAVLAVGLVVTSAGPVSADTLFGVASGKLCLVAGEGGINDHAFNQSAWTGLQLASAKTHVPVQYVQSSSQNDYAPDINAYTTQGCTLIVTVGFTMADATQSAASANPKQKFAIVDQAFSPPLANVTGLIFRTNEAAFLGGYLAAGMSKTGKVATYGGQKIPPVTAYMDGFWDGVMHYDRVHHAKVRVLGWNERAQNGTFTNSFTDVAKAQQLTRQFIQQGADVLFPLTGAGQNAVATTLMSEPSGKVMLEWSDTDGCLSAPQFCKVILTSVQKGVASGVAAVAEKAVAGNLSGSTYVGSLANNGVGLSPFHTFARNVPRSLRRELIQLRAALATGKVRAPSPSAPR